MTFERREGRRPHRLTENGSVRAGLRSRFIHSGDRVPSLNCRAAADSPAGRALALPLTGQREPKPMRYQPIENHGIIGNMHSAALVSLDGSVDWLCLPRFDSPSVFGAILDADKGGRFRIAPAAAGELRHKQYYWPDTNVLITRFLHPDGIAEVEDYMPVGPGAGPDAQLVRRVRVVRGRLPLEVECRPAFDYARARHATDGERARRPLRRPGPVPGAGRLGPPPARRRRGGGRVPPRRGPERHLRPAGHRAGRPPRPVPRDRGGRGLVPRDGRLLAAVGGPLHLPGPLARGGPALGPGAEAAHLPADRGDRRRPDHQPAGGDRRGAELGLPLHLDSRRRVHGLRLPAGRLHRGGGPVHGLADRPLEGARLALRRAAAAHVRHGRPVRPGRAGADAPRRLRGVEAGPDRQRRPRAAAAGHLRRADGRGLPVQQVRRPGRLRLLEAPPRPGRLGGRQLGPGGRGRLGGARRAAALRLLEVHVLGGAGPRPAAGGQALLPGRPGRLAEGPRRDLRGGDGARAGASRGGRSCSPTAPTPWTPPPCSCR